MILNRIDKEILEVLRLYPEGLSLNQIARKINNTQPYTYNKLKRMVIYCIIKKVVGKPTFYRIDLNVKTKDLKFYYVLCPKCKTQHKIHNKQQTVLCINKECKTKSNKRTRFFIYDKRIIKEEII